MSAPASPETTPAKCCDQCNCTDKDARIAELEAAERQRVLWQLGAMRQTVNLATARGMVGSNATSLSHLLDMLSRMSSQMSSGKLGRWLGWAQCAVVSSGCATLDEMKEINRLKSEATD